MSRRGLGRVWIVVLLCSAEKASILAGFSTLVANYLYHAFQHYIAYHFPSLSITPAFIRDSYSLGQSAPITKT